MMVVLFNDFCDLLFDLFRFGCVFLQLLGVVGGIGFAVLVVYLGCTRRGVYFMRWLHDEFGL